MDHGKNESTHGSNSGTVSELDTFAKMLHWKGLMIKRSNISKVIPVCKNKFNQIIIFFHVG